MALKQLPATTSEIVVKVHDMVKRNRRVKVRGLSEAMSISAGRVYVLIFIAYLLTPQQRQIHSQTSSDPLQVWSTGSISIFCDYDWKFNSPLNKTANSKSSAGKVMASIFSNSKGIILSDYFEKGKKLLGNIMRHFWRDWRQWLQKNALEWTENSAKIDWTNISFQILPHSTLFAL